MVELNLPLPPSVNRIWRRAGTRIHKSDEYRAWLKEAGWLAKAQRPGRISGPYKLTALAVRPDKRRRDLGNLEKPLSDLLVEIGVIDDDRYADMISFRWVTTGEGIVVRIEPAGIE